MYAAVAAGFQIADHLVVYGVNAAFQRADKTAAADDRVNFFQRHFMVQQIIQDEFAAQRKLFGNVFAVVGLQIGQGVAYGYFKNGFIPPVVADVVRS